MCQLLKVLNTGCNHVEEKVLACSRAGSLCTSYTTIEPLEDHPGECPKCLQGNVWPLSVLGATEESESDQVYVDVADIRGYAQSLLDFIVLQMSHLLKTRGQETTLDQKHLLETIYKETACSHEESKLRLGEGCAFCDDDVRYSNTSVRLRRWWANAIYDQDFKDSVAAGKFTAEVARIEATAPVRDLSNGAVYTNFPFFSSTVEDRHDFATEIWDERLRDFGTKLPSDGNCKTPEGEAYEGMGHNVLAVAAAILAYDVGVAPRVFEEIITHLLKVMQYPGYEHPKYSWTDKAATLDYVPYWTVAMAFAAEGDVAARTMSMVLDNVNACLRTFRFQQQAALNERAAYLLRVRVGLYTTPHPELPADWFCPICYEGPASHSCGTAADHDHDDDGPGVVVKIKRCGHEYHYRCLTDCVVGRPLNNNQCPLCRQRFDSVEAWQAVRGFERVDDDVEEEDQLPLRLPAEAIIAPSPVYESVDEMPAPQPPLDELPPQQPPLDVIMEEDNLHDQLPAGQPVESLGLPREDRILEVLDAVATMPHPPVVHVALPAGIDPVDVTQFMADLQEYMHLLRDSERRDRAAGREGEADGGNGGDGEGGNEGGDRDEEME